MPQARFISANSCGVLMRRSRFARRLPSTNPAPGNAAISRIIAELHVRAPTATRLAGAREAAARAKRASPSSISSTLMTSPGTPAGRSNSTKFRGRMKTGSRPRTMNAPATQPWV